jgi:hypothetical protein
MVCAIWNYGFLRVSPGLLAEKILDSVEDLVLLYDVNGKRVYQNNKSLTVLNGKKIADSGKTWVDGEDIHKGLFITAFVQCGAGKVIRQSLEPIQGADLKPR